MRSALIIVSIAMVLVTNLAKGEELHPFPPSVVNNPAPAINLDPYQACGPPNHFWLRADVLLWWTQNSQLPPMVTTGIPGPLPGVLGQPGTSVLFGGSQENNPFRVGGRFSGGFWLNSCHTIGLEGSYFFLAPQTRNYDSGAALITRPFFDILSALPNAQVVAYPGIATGRLQANSYSRFQGADLNLFCQVCRPACEPVCDPCAENGFCANATGPAPRSSWLSSLVLLGGFRYLQLDEGLRISEISQVNPALPAGPPLFGGSTIAIQDQFDTRNSFYGPQIGARAECCWGSVFANVVGKVALGVTQQQVDIRGTTSITSPDGTSVVTPVGFLASGSNSGRFTRNQFAVVPEIGVNLGCQITPHLRASVGYTFLYWSSVVRAPDLIDLGLSGTQIPTDSRYNPAAGPARPTLLQRDTDFWAQGVNLGLELRY